MPSDSQQDRIKQQIVIFKKQLQDAFESNKKIVMIDEFLITKRSIPSQDWAPLNHNMTIDLKQANEKPIAVIIAISIEKGIEMYMQFENSINSFKFRIFIEELVEQIDYNRF